MRAPLPPVLLPPALLVVLGASASRAADKPDAGALRVQANTLFGPLPGAYDSRSNPPSADKLLLGRLLYFDKRLSRNHDVSCNTCHPLDRFGAEHEATSRGHRGQKGDRNAPTVFNAAGHFVQFWDGRARDVEAQAEGPMLNPKEMALPDARAVEAVLEAVPGYPPLFARAFPAEPRPVTLGHAARAIAAFERRLTTPGRWDRFLAGDAKALTVPELGGLQTFIATGCATCHLGPLIGGGMFQKAGLVKPWPNLTDPGRAAVTRQDADRGFFKVPSLRNVARTAPYMHDGTVASLEQAVRLMAEHQLGRQLDDGDVAEIVTFLGALTGDLPRSDIREPRPLPFGKNPPRPDPH